MLLLTNMTVKGKNTCLRILKTYLSRWRIEESYRFQKVQFKLENIRVQSLNSIRALVFLANVAAGLIAVLANKEGESILVAEILTMALRLHGMPKLALYAVADGIRNIMQQAACGIAAALAKPPPSAQMSLFEPGAFIYSAA